MVIVSIRDDHRKMKDKISVRSGKNTAKNRQEKIYRDDLSVNNSQKNKKLTHYGFQPKKVRHYFLVILNIITYLNFIAYYLRDTMSL